MLVDNTVPVLSVLSLLLLVLAGQGIARQRQAIVNGLRDSVLVSHSWLHAPALCTVQQGQCMHMPRRKAVYNVWAGALHAGL